MGLFDRLKRRTSKFHVSFPLISLSFGRYSDSYKTDEQLDAWEKSIQHFDKENYAQSVEFFLKYLKDEQNENIKYWDDERGLNFELYQGSKKLIGLANTEHIEVEVKVAKCDELTVEFMKRLMEKNYELKYGRFALDESDDISMKFDTHVLDGSPFKLYYALKEVATNADKLDDLLIEEFDMLSPIDTGHIEEIPPAEKEIKYNFIQRWVKDNQAVRSKYPKSKFSAGIAYTLLALAYKIDYLIKPEGMTMESVERIHRLYFASDQKTISQKIGTLEQEIETIYNRPKADFKRELYKVISTFGITIPVTHERIQSFIDGELPNMDWYIDNGHTEMALAITDYIVGYCLFNFALPQPVRAYFHIYYMLMDKPYFTALGFEYKWIDEDQKLNKSAIKKEILAIAKANKKHFPDLNPKVNILDYSSLEKFAQSYLQMIRRLDLTK